MSHPVIRFPPPPPTHNNLTAEQRTQLMRSNKKLGQLLGSTPHVLDISSPPAPLRVEIPLHCSADDALRKAAKSHRRSKSVCQPSENRARDCSPIPASPRPSTSSSYFSQSSSHSENSEQRWRAPYHPTRRPPLLKLLPAEPTLDPVPGSPPCEHEVVPDSPSAPVFSIPSEASLRRTKMRRLARKLGEGVPIDLVFPPQADTVADSDEEETPLLETPSSEHRLPLPTIPEGAPAIARASLHGDMVEQPPVRRSSFAKEGKQAAYRDAVYIIDSPEEHGFESFCVGVPSASSKGWGGRLMHDERPSGPREDQEMVCLGVSASTGQGGKGRSRRWVQGSIRYDQIAAWHGGVW